MSSAAVPSPAPRTFATSWARLRRLWPLGLSLLITLAAAPLAFLISQQAGDLHSYGPLAYPIVFAVMALTSATLFLPAPGAAVAAAAGTFLDPIGVAIFAGLGSATGELSGYLLGYYGRRAVPTDRSRLWRLTERGFRRWGFLALLILALIPNPVFDALGILAGGLRYPIWRFWLATAPGKVIKFYLFAYGGLLLSLWMKVS